MSERTLFLAALDIDDPTMRSAYLDRACAGEPSLRAQLDALLTAHLQADEFMEQTAPDLAGITPAEGPGAIIGPYRLLEQIGEGGFGVVYSADQLRPVRRLVALKILKPGMETRQVVARFEAERQALALMDHPNIARVLDGGETSRGRPFFVMELVRGITITKFATDNGLAIRDRLHLFLAVCQAVQHAHQKGIIHRDLKPSNVLVTTEPTGSATGVNGVVKVIDFGIAKALGQQLTDKTLITGCAQMIGTPMYMSPEQADMTPDARGDTDTRTDIYSLGVLLYELLTGTTPCDRDRVKTVTFDEVRRIIREEEPVRPSTCIQHRHSLCKPTQSAGLRQPPMARLRELDWIVLKALEKDRNRRYESVGAFAADVQRYLDDEPVQACPPSVGYRLHKLLRRHRGSVLAASMLFLSLVAGIVGTTWGLIRATHSESVAVKQAKEKEEALTIAQDSERDARDKLFLALLNQARAGRFSRQVGQRLDVLDALAKAAAIRPDPQLRDEAIAALALPDVHPGPRWQALPPGSMLAVFDADYRWYARLNDQHTISVRTVAEDREVQSIAIAPATAPKLGISPDGAYVLHLDDLANLTLWRVNDAKLVLQPESLAVATWQFSPDCRHLALAHEDWIIIFDPMNGAELNRWQVAGPIKQLAFSPDSRRLAVGYVVSSSVPIYDATTGEVLAKLSPGKISNQVVAWHPDGKRLAVAGSEPRIQLFEVASDRRLATYEGHVQNVTVLSFHPDGDLLASGSWDGVVRMWDVASGRPLMQLPLRLFVSFSRDGQWFGVAWQGADAQLYRAAPTCEYRTIVSSQGVFSVSYNEGSISRNGRLLTLDMGSEGVHVWDLPSGREVATLPAGLPLFRPDGRELLIGNREGLHRWPLQEGAKNPDQLHFGTPHDLPMPLDSMTRLAASTDGLTLAIASEQNNKALIVNLADETATKHSLEHVNAGYVAVSKDGRWAASSGWHSAYVRLWNAHSGALVHEWRADRVTVFFTPDNRHLVIGQSDEFQFWDVTSFKLVRRLQRDVDQYPGWIAFTEDGRLMAMEMAPAVIHIKDVETGRTIAKLEDPHSDRATWLSFTPDGTQLVCSARYARVIHLWDLRAIRERLKPIGLDWDWPEFPH